MRSHLLATAILASLGLAAAPDTFAANPPVTAAQLEQLQAQIAALQSQVQQLQAQSESLQAQSDAQSEVNVVQAQAVEASQATTAKVDKLSKLVNDTKVGGRIFFDATSIDQKNNGTKTASSGTGFDVTRFYLTFDHAFNDIWSANLTTDAQYLSITPGTGGSVNQANSVEVFIKKAYVQAKFGDELFLRAGAADAPWIPFVEKYAGFRYVQNLLVDRLSYGTSADWGVHAGGESNGFNYAASISNGRGYRNPSRSKGVDFEARVGYAPTANTIIGVGGYSGKRGLETELVDPPHTAERINAMAAYASSKFRFGGEWFQAKNWAVTNVADDKAQGWSLWASAALTESGITAFGRYDKTDTSKQVNPDYQNTYYHLGVEFPITKGIKLATVYKQTKAETSSELETKEFGVFGDVQF
ncbi:MAG TPA: porin [Xanthomonadaceae bacterium]|nr:porin [Xanthomonadaceae bacterium]